MSDNNERKTAADILTDVRRGAQAGTCLKKISGLDKTSRSFITQLVYGTLENYIYLDHIIDHFSKVPVRKMKPYIASLLEMSVYQLLFLDSVPEHAIVNEAVSLTQKSSFKNLKAFVNAVLRNIARNKTALPEPEGGALQQLSVKYSIPEFILNIFQEAAAGQGKELEDICKGLRSRRPLSIRCNTSKVTPSELEEKLKAEGVSVGQRSHFPKYAFEISGFDSIALLDTFKQGLFYVQDVSSMLSCEAAGFRKGERVLDICGAPGGKSVGAALAGALVTCRDKTDEKTQLIRENVKRLGLKAITAETKDALVFDAELEESFDAVIADVPCSGLGIIGRKPDICLHVSPESIDELIELQMGILENAVSYVRPGGRLIFSTCTINRRENEENGRFLEEKGFEGVFEKLWLPGGEEATDGFYTKILRKKMR